MIAPSHKSSIEPHYFHRSNLIINSIEPYPFHRSNLISKSPLSLRGNEAISQKT
ncbi:hypothetical protein ACN4EE_08330 [Geminocystis sp. CENA526]|uniref:hypothetical protein n=1 Tax=Geminocystis sp. CENA526 TaxID=1355871 RepID=UPI003D6DC4CE